MMTIKVLNIKKNVMIYGAGEAGRQLASSLKRNKQFKVKGFFDDNKKLHKKILLGHTIYPGSFCKELVENKKISFLFIAMPSINRHKKNLIIKKFNGLNVVIKTLPSVSEIINGRVTISDIKDFNINDLLDRDQVKPNNRLLKKKIENKTIVVTGAGGSIGSEICRQIIKFKPKKLLLFELNEFNLYKIYEELIKQKINKKIHPILINIQDQNKLELLFKIFKVDTVYHAAAYKHVPLVEENICSSIENNVFGTLALIKASLNKKINDFVLISSDKAVRPTNIMGATKRLAELCVQGFYKQAKNNACNFSIVRFGNVLESSGSVIPKFKRQIFEDGVVTLTHKKVTRYFMTVTEAAQLVIQAGAMAKNCEVFVLDMGKSNKIYDLIKKMIYLSGLKIKDKLHPDGDVLIKTIGLRPGEKLFEELLIGDNPKKTIHPKIKKINDPTIKFEELREGLKNLKDTIIQNNSLRAKKILKKLVTSYNSNTKIVDLIHNERSN